MFVLPAFLADVMPEDFVLELMREAASIVIVCSLSVTLWRGSIPLRELLWPAREKAAVVRKASRAAPAPLRQQQQTPQHISSSGAATAAVAASVFAGGEAGGTDALSRPAAERLPPQASVTAAQKRILLYLEKHQFTLALNAFRAYEREGLDRFFDEELFSNLIQASIRVTKLDVTLGMLRKMKRNCMKPTVAFWQSIFRLLASRKLYSDSLAVHELWGDEMPDDRVIFTCLVNAALEMKKLGLAANILKKKGGMVKLQPNDYVIFFRTYVGLSDAAQAEELFDRLCDVHGGAVVTAHMLNLALLACVNGKEASRAIDLIRKAHKLNWGPGTKLKTIVDVVSYNTVLTGCATAAPGSRSQCYDCLHGMLEHRIDFDEITCRLLDACIDGDSQLSGDICNLLMDRKWGLSTAMYTFLIKVLVHVGRLPKALEVYGEMKHGRIARPDMSTYSVLLKALMDHHELERAFEVIAEMQSAGKNLDDVMLMHILDGCRDKCNIDMGMSIFNDAVARGLKVSVFTVASLLKLLGRSSKVREAIEVLEACQERHGWKPTVVHYTCVVSACLRTGQPDLAWKAYKMMLSNNVAPDETAVKTLARCLQDARHWDRMLELSHEAAQLPVPIKISPDMMKSALAHVSSSAGGKVVDRLP